MKSSPIKIQSGRFEVIENGDLLSVPGFFGTAVATNVKANNLLDLGIISTAAPVTATAVFTKNMLPAAPVVLGRETLARSPQLKTIIINSGNANALTGDRGMQDARRLQSLAADLWGGPSLVLSTGVIGVPLEMQKIEHGLLSARESLSAETTTTQSLAESITTTDSCTKTCALRVNLPAHGDHPKRTITVGGMAKGSGMIHPNMATMLAFIGTDAEVAAPALQAILKRAVDQSFHEISVDGDTSTNDTVVLMAGGQAMPKLDTADPRLEIVEAAIHEVAKTLALQIVYDGEGKSRIMELHVTGAHEKDAARKIAKSIVTSLLVKTALAGADPNWGRILAAAANAGEELQTQHLSLTIQNISVFAHGAPQKVDVELLQAAVKEDLVRFDLCVGNGTSSAHMYTTDITKEYVAINSEYTT